MISDTHKCIFIHIPKCAGSSIEKFFTPDIEWCNQYHRTHCEQHLTFGEMASLNCYGGNITDYFKFTIVRNPWSRHVSAWQFARERYKRTKKYSFRQFCMNLKNVCPQRGINRIYYGLINRQQVDYITDDKKNIAVDFIGKVENLQEDFNTICDKIGIPRQELPHHNKSKHKHYTEYYDDETREIIAEKYAKDIEMFGYEFGE